MNHFIYIVISRIVNHLMNWMIRAPRIGSRYEKLRYEIIVCES